MKDITMMNMWEVSKLIEEKEISPVDLVDACYKRISDLDEDLIAFITLTEEKARTDARKAEKEIALHGQKSPLHGIPYAVKDLFYTEGILTTAGSKFLIDFRPKYNATAVQRCEDAGGILIGKTNTHEWAFACNTRSYFGESKNPWNPNCTPGGSSGGSAIAAATGMAYTTLGTDTGGSCRTPASMCGIVGFKPTYGLTSQYGVIPLSYSLDHIGTLSRSVMDVAITMDIISGYDPNDPCPSRTKEPPTKFAKELKKVENLKGKIIGVPINFFFERVDFEVERLFKEAIRALEELGAEIKYIEVPNVEDFPPMAARIMFSEAAHFHRERLAENLDGFGIAEQERFTQGAKWTAVEFIDAMKVRETVSRSWEEAVSQVDAIAVPTNPVTAPPIGAQTISSRGVEETAGNLIVRHTRLGSFAGVPSLSIPMGFTNEGMPSGLMLMGGQNRDLDVLKIGWAYEQNNPYKFLTF